MHDMQSKYLLQIALFQCWKRAGWFLFWLLGNGIHGRIKQRAVRGDTVMVDVLLQRTSEANE